MPNTVYFAAVADGAGAEAQADALEKVLTATGFLKRLDRRDWVAIKLHVGEKNNVTHVKPELAARVAALVTKAHGSPFLTDTSTLYKSQRENAIRHILHAHAHGFSIENTGAPFIPLDGLSGTHEREVVVDGELSREVKIAGELFLADALIVLTHATGHPGSGLGAALKNVGMGLSSRSGKMRQHSSIQPEVVPGKCADCGKCRKWCPVDAIEEKQLEKKKVSFIIRDRCIGCGECIAVCRFGAVKFDYGIESATMQKSMVEHAAGALRHFKDKAVYVNVLVDMTRGCDCFDVAQKKAVPDLGILASNDITAVDQATLDLTGVDRDKDLARLSFPKIDPTVQFQHAEKMGLGSRDYQLIRLPP